MPGMDHGSMTSPAASGHSGMDHGMPAGDGLSPSASGFRFVLAPSPLPAGQPAEFRFQIVGADGKPVTVFEPDQTKLMHFYLIRSDLAGFQHIHPTMGGDGTWSAPVQPVDPGSYRAYVSFIARGTSGKAVPLVLGDRATVAGTATTTPLPPASSTAEADGYTLTLAGTPMAGMAHTLTATVSKNGQPVTDLQPYLDTYAHLTAFHEGDLAFAHLHPQGRTQGDHGGPTLSFDAKLPTPGNWRLFVQFQTGGLLHTAAVTLSVQ